MTKQTTRFYASMARALAVCSPSDMVDIQLAAVRASKRAYQSRRAPADDCRDWTDKPAPIGREYRRAVAERAF